MGAIRADTDVVDIDFDVWDRVMAVNLRGYVAAMKYAIPAMLGRGGGAIVNCVPGRARSTGLRNRESRRRRAHPPRRVAVGKRRYPV